ncbi:CrcB-like protein-domain-containing protein, partial [Myxozyma melibiosi]
DIFEILCLLAFFSVWGALARLGLSSLEGYPGAAVQPLVWAQFVGCVVMGALAELKDFFVVADGRNLQLFVGLSTGFCGSFTTFSSWMSTTFLAMANAQPSYDRPRGYSVLGLIDGITLTLAFSLTGLKFGREVGVFVRHLWTKSLYGFNLVSGRRTVPTMKVLAVGLGAGCWIGVLLMCIFIKKWRGNALFAATFGPMGTFLRWYLSRKLNPLNPRFPIGTFAANIFGTIVIGCLMIGQQRVYQRADPTACQVLQGLMDGFCGCLTTISTFVLELVTLERRNAWTYGSVSVVCGVVCMCLTAGVDHWRFRAHEVVRC